MKTSALCFLVLMICVGVACAQELPLVHDGVPQCEAVSKAVPRQAPRSVLILRGSQTFLIQPLADGTVSLKLTYMPVNQSKPLTTKLLDSSGAVLFEGVVAGVEKIQAKPTTPGTCELRVETDGGSMKLDSPCAWAVHGTMHGFRCLPSVYVFVPRKVTSFLLHVRGGGGKEHIVWTLDSGLGVPVKSVDTSLEGVNESVRIDVPKGMSGRVWTLTFAKPTKGFNEDFSVSASGGVEPLFAMTPDRVLRDKLIPTTQMEKTYGRPLKAMGALVARSSQQGETARHWRARVDTELEAVAQAILTQRRYAEQPALRKRLAGASRLATAFAAGRLTSREILAGSIQAISNERVLPTDTSVPGELGGAVRITAARGEFESGSFVVLPEVDFGAVEATVSVPRTAAGATLPVGCVDMRIVKAWFQDEGSGYRRETPTHSYNPIRVSGRSVLMPELLLHDDGLVRVDIEGERNEMRVGVNADGSPRYICISDPEGVPGKTLEDFPVVDAPSLLPFDLRARRLKQFWVTVHVPGDAQAGVYQSKIQLLVGGRVLLEQPLEIRVLPFVLPRASTVCGIYYYTPNSAYYGERVMRQYRREMENLRDHGVLDIMHPYSATNAEALQIRREAGMSESSILFYRGWYAHSVKEGTPNRLDIVRQKTREHLGILRGYGFKEIYFYGIDEAKGDRLAGQRETWNAMRELGAKIFVAGYRGSNFKLMGDIQDLLVCAGYPSREESAQWHSKGQKIISYGNPQGGCEAPDTYRRNFGFLLWQYGYDGCMTYIYHWGGAQNWGSKRKGQRDFASVWNDFCRKDSYKQHNMVYPTADGVVDTLQWEGYREAIDDLRYMTVLEQRLAAAPADSAAAVEARGWLANLRTGDINADLSDCDAIRAEIVKRILALK